jgi:hypothetical protein
MVLGLLLQLRYVDVDLKRELERGLLGMGIEKDIVKGQQQRDGCRL